MLFFPLFAKILILGGMLTGSKKSRRRELRMCHEKEDKQGSCGTAFLSSIFQDIGEPCLHHSIKVVRTIKPSKAIIFFIVRCASILP